MVVPQAAHLHCASEVISILITAAGASAAGPSAILCKKSSEGSGTTSCWLGKQPKKPGAPALRPAAAERGHQLPQWEASRGAHQRIVLGYCGAPLTVVLPEAVLEEVVLP